MTNIEAKAFAMFKQPSTDAYKRHVMATAKELIDATPRITVNKLKAAMYSKYFIEEADVEGALSALLNVYFCISSFKVPQRDAVHLNPKESEVWDNRNFNQLQTA